ncbi:MAG: AraC family ligand binding domain-containing protein, partial [Clostridia bacterium]|nr:AraC family ligand binding domain-containing protein [Clostridia bacterium]
MEYFFRNYYLATSYVLTDIYPIQYGEQQCEEGYAFGPRIRSNYILHYVYSGCGILRIGNQEYSVNAGELFLIKPNQVAFYKADTKSPWLYRWIEFNGSMAERIVSAFGKDGARPVLFDEGGVIGDKFIDFISQGKMAFEPAMERFWGIISGLTKSSADSAPIRSQDYVQMAEQYMKDNLHR